MALMNGSQRFGVLRRSIGSVTRHMLAPQPRELKQGGLVSRTAFAEKAATGRVRADRRGLRLLPAFKEMLSRSRLYEDAHHAVSQLAHEG
ncbi:winged helix-turn-helix transcriptional regulator [Bradyrhizobium sp. AS23.2]|uniref:winged helix-turn-helix transcriptional regulator n=1 Tax=Bradyrhizobium sp. AS23.2 TaxID=1680155 RepID=UPI00093CA909|nr:winged helix-turn-helix transcriptional regulator [Bradyrhizobium sp. AS23.2]